MRGCAVALEYVTTHSMHFYIDLNVNVRASASCPWPVAGAAAHERHLLTRLIDQIRTLSNPDRIPV